jgi:hypothetical protein
VTTENMPGAAFIEAMLEDIASWDSTFCGKVYQVQILDFIDPRTSRLRMGAYREVDSLIKVSHGTWTATAIEGVMEAAHNQIERACRHWPAFPVLDDPRVQDLGPLPDVVAEWAGGVAAVAVVGDRLRHPDQLAYLWNMFPEKPKVTVPPRRRLLAQLLSGRERATVPSSSGPGCASKD